MEIARGQLLEITHSRKGVFVAVALTDFDTGRVSWWPVAVAEGVVKGAGEDWVAGKSISCRASMVTSVRVLLEKRVLVEKEE